MKAELKQQARADEKVRVAIEGKFGQAKRRFSLARVMAKLAQMAQCAIAITFLVLNLERWLRQLLMLLCWLYGLYIKALNQLINLYGRSQYEEEELQQEDCWSCLKWTPETEQFELKSAYTKFRTLSSLWANAAW